MRPPASWVIVDRDTGRPVLETFRASIVEKVNTARYEAVPILEYLYRFNASISAESN